MFTKLDEVEKKYDALTVELSKPEVIFNQLQYQKIAKEHAGLTELVSTYRRYKKITKELLENKHILEDERDEDLRKMAKEEISRLEDEQLNLIQQLKVLLLPKDPN